MKTQLLVADYVARLDNGKMAVMGLYADRLIVLQMPPLQEQTAPAGIQSLSFLMTLFELQAGSYDLHACVRLPDLSVNWETDMPRIEPQITGPATFAFTVAPFPMPQEGTYTFEMTLGDAFMTEAFEVRYAQMQPIA